MLGAGKSMLRHTEVCCLAKATFMALRKHLPTECAWWVIRSSLDLLVSHPFHEGSWLYEQVSFWILLRDWFLVCELWGHTFWLIWGTHTSLSNGCFPSRFPFSLTIHCSCILNFNHFEKFKKIFFNWCGLWSDYIFND